MITSFFTPLALNAQNKEVVRPDDDTIQFEKPLNFFASAGAAYRIGNQYNVAVSPVDYSVQFEEVYPIVTRFSLGLVWNPFPNKKEDYLIEYKKRKNLGLVHEAARRHLAVALLINIFQLGYSSGDFSANAPIDVGFGLGYRKSNFLILGTIDFTPESTPRKFFIDQYHNQSKQLILAGNTEPIRTISSDNSSLFTKRIFPSVGIKIAYTFAKKSNETVTPN